MKICFVAWDGFGPGGISRTISTLVNELSKQHEVSILCLKNNPKNFYGINLDVIKMFSYEQNVWSKIRRELLSKIQSIFPIYQWGWFLKNYIRLRYPSSFTNYIVNHINEYQYDVVVGASGLNEALLIGGITNRIRSRTYGWLHTSFYLYFKWNSNNISYQNSLRLAQYYLNRLKCNVVLSKYDMNIFITHQIKSTSIYNSVTLSNDKRTQRIGMNKRMIYAGDLNKHIKGVDVLIDGFNFFTQKNQEWKLVIFGKGPEEVFINQKIKEYNLAGRVELHPFTNKLFDEFCKSDLLIFTSKIEGFGLVMIEAMSTGLPIVASEIPVTNELLKDRGVAWLFESGNSESLADQLENAVNSPLEAYSAKAEEYAKEFSVEKIARQWIELFEG